MSEFYHRIIKFLLTEAGLAKKEKKYECISEYLDKKQTVRRALDFEFEEAGSGDVIVGLGDDIPLVIAGRNSAEATSVWLRDCRASLAMTKKRRARNDRKGLAVNDGICLANQAARQIWRCGQISFFAGRESPAPPVPPL